MKGSVLRCNGSASGRKDVRFTMKAEQTIDKSCRQVEQFK